MIEFKQWKAYQDHLPGPNAGPRLYVVGEGVAPTTGFTATLARAEPQGIAYPHDLLLDLTVTAPQGPALDVVWPLVVEYFETSSDRHDTVTIRGEGGVTIQVEHIQ